MATKMKKLGKILDESNGALRTGVLREAAEPGEEPEPKIEEEAAGLDMKEMKDAVEAELTTFAKKILLLVKSWCDDFDVDLSPEELAEVGEMVISSLKTKSGLMKTAAKLVAKRGDSMARGLKKEL